MNTTMNTPATDILNHPQIIWLREQLDAHGGNKTALAKTLGDVISSKTIGLLLEGRYQYNVEGMLKKLEEQQRRLSGQLHPAAAADLAHIPTPMMAQAWAAFDAAKSAHLVNIIAGKSQIGKTTAAEAYKMRYPETTVFMRMPTRPTMASVLAELCSAAGLPKGRTTAEAVMRLRDRLTAAHLIIVDEAHLCLGRRQGADALDMLRELYDRCGCGLVLIVTDTGAREFVRGQFAGQLAQLERRGEWELLPPEPCAADVQAIWQAYDLPEPDKETQAAIYAMARASCFGQYVHRLKWAAVQARRAGQPLSWQFFLQATHAMTRRPQ